MCTPHAPSRVVLEVIATSLADARAAAAGGADRIELCAALNLGGLTPSIGLLDAVQATVELPVMFILRPRESGFGYAEDELSVMQRDAELALEHGADGLVFGCLTDGGEIDERASARLLHVARQRGACQTVFHRAFDVVADPVTALERLIDLGFTRVLTSGRAARAVDGIDQIRRTVEQAAGRIEVLAGGGITADNVRRVIETTGVDQVHASLTMPATDRSTAANLLVRFSTDQDADEREHRVTDPEAVRAVRAVLEGIRIT